MRLPCAKGERFLPADRVTTGWSKLGRFGYALACFIFRFLRRPPDDLCSCADALRSGQDAVFLPAEDGGYVLVGLRRPQPRLFADIEWGTERVMAQTRDRLRELGLLWSEPRTLWDVDRPEDLDRLRAMGLAMPT
ncbi:MAG: DUF2064 domain-containing protein [Dechloromonas sp.]|nr:DUF2064 domain-containing protein [Dechloromonas sp.]